MLYSKRPDHTRWPGGEPRHHLPDRFDHQRRLLELDVVTALRIPAQAAADVHELGEVARLRDRGRWGSMLVAEGWRVHGADGVGRRQ
jgi:hypothetical protein